jgi:hypothetical protein
MTFVWTVAASSKRLTVFPTERAREHRCEPVVEGSGDFPSEFHVGCLIRSDWDDICFHQEDVGRLQDRVAEKAVRRPRGLQLAQLVLERRDSLCARDGDEHREIEEQSRVPETTELHVMIGNDDEVVVAVLERHTVPQRPDDVP